MIYIALYLLIGLAMAGYMVYRDGELLLGDLGLFAGLAVFWPLIVITALGGMIGDWFDRHADVANSRTVIWRRKTND